LFGTWTTINRGSDQISQRLERRELIRGKEAANRETGRFRRVDGEDGVFIRRGAGLLGREQSWGSHKSLQQVPTFHISDTVSFPGGFSQGDGYF